MLQWVETQRFLSKQGTDTQECFHFQHLLDKVCIIFHTVCDAYDEREHYMLISRGVLKRERQKVNRRSPNEVEEKTRASCCI